MKKKILFLINTLRDGGAEKILVDIVNHLNPEEYDIEVKLIYKKGVYLDKLNDNIKLSFIAGKPGTFMATQVSRILPRLSSECLHKLFVKEHYDIEVAFLEGYATKIVAGAPKNVKKIAWVHCDLTKTEWITGVFRSEKGFVECYKKIDEVVSVSQSVQEAFVERFGEITKLIVRYNPVPDKKIRELSNQPIELHADGRKITLVSLGRMTYPKNFMRLLKCVKNVISDGYSVELWLLGEGEEKEKLKQYIEDNHLEEQIKLLGFKKNPYPYIKQANLYVCSSIYEGFSTAATESLILGVPVLTTEVSGMREMLGDNEYGMITKNTDEDFEAGLRRLLCDEKVLKYYKSKALERGAFFEFDKRLQEIETLF